MVKGIRVEFDTEADLCSKTIIKILDAQMNMPNIVAIKKEFIEERRKFFRHPVGEPFKLNMEELENHISSLVRQDSELNRYIKCILDYEMQLGILL